MTLNIRSILICTFMTFVDGRDFLKRPWTCTIGWPQIQQNDQIKLQVEIWMSNMYHLMNKNSIFNRVKRVIGTCLFFSSSFPFSFSSIFIRHVRTCFRQVWTCLSALGKHARTHPRTHARTYIFIPKYNLEARSLKLLSDKKASNFSPIFANLNTNDTLLSTARIE